MSQNYTGDSCRTSIENALPALLVIILVVSCYFVYPSWKILKLPFDRVIIYSFFYLLSLALTLRVSTGFFSRRGRVVCGQKPSCAKNSAIGNGTLIVLIGLFAGYQLSYLGLPILSGPDEPLHISTKLWQWELYTSIPNWELFIFFCYHLALVAVLVVIAVPVKLSHSSSRWLQVILRILPMVSVVLLPVILYLVVWTGEHLPVELGINRRWPPLGMIVGVMSFSLFGASEFSARFPSFLFYCGTGFFVYKIVETDLGWKAGILGLVACLASPLFFSYGHLDFREMGGVFFMTLGCYCLLSYVRTGTLIYLGYLVFAVIAGYLERRPAAILFFIAALVCLINLVVVWFKKEANQKQVFNCLIAQSSLALVVVIGVFPWIFITGDVRPYHFYLGNFFHQEMFFAYMAKFSEFFPWPIVLLICTGIVGTFFKRQWSGIIALISFFALYILFTGDDPYWIPVERFAVFFIPFSAILISQTYGFFRSGDWKRMAFVVLAVVVCFSGLLAWARDTPEAGLIAKSTRTVSGYPHYPFNELLLSLKGHGVDRGNILFPVYWQSAFPAYYRMYQMWGYTEIVPSWKANKRKTTIKQTQKLCRVKKCRALVIPFVTGDDGVVKVRWVEGITYQTVQENTVPGFNVLGIYEGTKKGLVLLEPYPL